MLNKNSNLAKCQGGFTLIEILIVMVIIGILATIGFGSFQSSQIKGRDANRKSDLQQIARSLETYYNDRGEYPLGLGGIIYGCTNNTACEWGTDWTGENGTIYMVTLPTDPRSSVANYYYESDQTYYQLYARLENSLDRDLDRDDNDAPLEFSSLSCGVNNCNYGISSSNATVLDGRTQVAY